MPLPNPTYALDNVCTAIFNNTLFTYTSTAFQSLELDSGGRWKVLPMGVGVTGGVCVKTTPVNNTETAALWIVGGSSDNSTYGGLQRYIFEQQKWETIRTSSAIAQNRLYHNAAYLNSSDSILLFAGSQDLIRQPSSHTFTIKATEPYDVTAYEANVPPAINPTLIAITQSKAMYLGGSETNTKMMVFSPSNSWEDSNATLALPFYNSTNIKATIQNGNDGSKTLMTFDMTVLPNSVNRTIFIDGEGNPVVNATPIVEVQRDSKPPAPHGKLARRGNLTVENWPEYNNTLAPSSTRTVYSVARDQSGMTVIVGGNPDDVLCIYKARSNCWVNATEKLSARAVEQGLGEPSSATTSLTLESSVPTSSSTTSPVVVPATGGSGPPIGTILGAVFGSLAGVILILLVFLYLVRLKKKRRDHMDAGHQRRSSGIPDEKMDFADRGLPHMTSTRQFRGHAQQNSAGSLSSIAILLGRVGHKRGSEKDGSVGSETSSNFNKGYKAAIGKPTLIKEEQTFQNLPDLVGDEKPILPTEERSTVRRTRGNSRGGRRGSTRRSSGWNRYWSGGSALNILGFGKRESNRESNRSSDSHYSEQRIQSNVTQMSAFVPPLKIGTRPEINRVISGSPTIRNGGAYPLPQEMKGRIERPGSVSTLSSYNDDGRDAFSSGVPTSIDDNDHQQQNYWTPIQGQSFSATRASSNLYSESNYPTTIGQETSLPRPPTSQQQPPNQPGQPATDMSWLNLGHQRPL